MTQKKILVPIDFSGCSVKALEVAVLLAGQINARLIVLNACQKPAAYADASVTAYSRDLVREAETNAQRAFESVEESIRGLQDVEFTFQVTHSFAQDAIISRAKSESFDLIVMGTTGASGLKEVLLGSNTHSVIKNVRCPVLAIPESSEAREFVKKIALAGDYQNTDERETYEMLIEIARAFEAEIHVLHVSEIPIVKTGEPEEAQKLDGYFEGLNRSFHYKIDKHVEDGINEYIKENNIDLLTLVAKKHNLLDRLFKGSTTRKMAYHSKIPLLILHAN